MLGTAVVVLVGLVAVWLVAMRCTRELSPDEAQRAGQRWIVGGGIALPGVAIAALIVFGSSAGFHQLPLPLGQADGPTALRVEAIGHQWSWELRYTESGVGLRNELRLPVGRPVDIQASSRDVIHSFWVPRLGGKIDAVPGRTNVIRLQADQAGTFRSQCAEFCGLGHAHMVMTVHAMAPADFDAWLDAQRAGAAAAKR